MNVFITFLTQKMMYLKYATLVPYRKLPASLCLGLLEEISLTQTSMVQRSLHNNVKQYGDCAMLYSSSTRRCLHHHSFNLHKWQLLPLIRSLHLHRPGSTTDTFKEDGKPLSTSKPSPIQISPDIYTQNREEIISALVKGDFRKSAPRYVRKAVEDATIPKSAVFLPLCLVNGEPSVLFTLRSANVTSHRTQVGFPGGRIDPTDVDSTHTAVREMEEELGIPSSYVDVWGELTPVVDRRFSVIYVTVGFIGPIESLDIRKNPHEVESVFTMTLRQLCDLDKRFYTFFTIKPGFTFPSFLGGEHRVWGLSALMLNQALEILLPDQYQSFKNIGLEPTPRKWAQ